MQQFLSPDPLVLSKIARFTFVFSAKLGGLDATRPLSFGAKSKVFIEFSWNQGGLEPKVTAIKDKVAAIKEKRLQLRKSGCS